jgi:hypothetical protein
VSETPETQAVEAAPAEATQIIRRQPKALSQRDPAQIAKAFAESGYWPDVKSAAQAVVKIVAGEELGLGPMAAMEGLTFIKGKLGFRGNLIATLVRQHETYRYKVVERTDENCKLEIWDGEDWNEVEFTLKDAARAQLVKDDSGWKKYPRAMCFNRALTEGVRAYIPDVTAGTPAYTEDEIEEVIETSPAPERSGADASESALPPERIQELSDLIRSVEKQLDSEGVNWLDGLSVLLGSIGIDGFSPNEPVADELAKLTPEQTDALEAELQKLVDTSTEGDDDAD